MKLIDLLLQELPKRGGWPDGATSAWQSTRDGEVYFCKENCMYSEENNGGRKWHFEITSDRGAKHAVTREQYEESLAAAKKTVWNGEGLPPVGCEFEYGKHRTKAKCLGVGHQMIFASKGEPDDEEGDFEEFMLSIVHSELHPVRSEADKKREAALDAIYGAIASAERAHNRSDEADKVYDAIAAGKVPGVKLDV